MPKLLREDYREEIIQRLIEHEMTAMDDANANPNSASPNRMFSLLERLLQKLFVVSNTVCPFSGYRFLGSRTECRSIWTILQEIQGLCGGRTTDLLDSQTQCRLVLAASQNSGILDFVAKNTISD
jgi:hypothetical protein